LVKLSFGVLHVPKVGSTAAQYEDASAYSAESRTAAVSDGAGTAFESGRWARLLTRAFVQRPPLGLRPSQVLDWVSQVSAEWTASIPWQDLNVFEEIKATSEGSAATLIGLRFEPLAPDAAVGEWRCMAIGDSCLFRVTGGQLVEAVPITKSAEFGRHPALFYTRPEATEHDIGKLVTAQGTWHSGDRFLLLTDAIAEWFLRQTEQGGRPWDTLASLDDLTFGSFVDDGRDHELIRNDDVTVVTLAIEPARQMPPPIGIQPPIRPDTTPAEPPVPARTRSPGGHVRLPAGPAPARPISSEPAGRPTSLAQRDRLRRTLLIVAFCLALLLGFVIGRVTVHSPPPPRATGTAGIQSAARKFAMALVTFQGHDLRAYESSLRALSTRRFDESLPGLLHLSPAAFRSADSNGRVISITISSWRASTVMVYMVVQQSITSRSADRSLQRFLLIRLAMARSGRNWLASRIEFITSADRPLPAPTLAATSHRPPSKKSSAAYRPPSVKPANSPSPPSPASTTSTLQKTQKSGEPHRGSTHADIS